MLQEEPDGTLTGQLFVSLNSPGVPETTTLVMLRGPVPELVTLMLCTVAAFSLVKVRPAGVVAIAGMVV